MAPSVRRVIGWLRGSAGTAALLAIAAPAAASVDHPSPESIARDEASGIWKPLAPGERDTFTIDLRAGEAVSIVVRQHGIDVVVTAVDPDGRQQHRVDRPNVEWGREAITIVAGASGRHRLNVVPLHSVGPSGRYRVEIGHVHAADADDRQRVEAEREVTEAEVARAANTLDASRTAAQRFERAALLWRALGEPYEESVALYGQALALRFLGDHERSLHVLQRMTALTRRGADDSDAALLAESGLAWTFLYLDDYDRAASHFRALLRRAGGDPRAAAVDLFGLAWTSLMRGRPGAAEPAFRRSLRLRRAVHDRRGEALTLIGLAAALDRLDRPREAAASATEALAILRTYKDQYGQAEALIVKGWALFHQREHAEAAELFAAAAAIRRALEDAAGEAAALHGQAAALRQIGASVDALDLAERGVALVESVRARRTDADLRLEYFASVQELYELCIDLLMERHAATGDTADARRAFHLSERARARSLLDRMHVRRGPASALPDHDTASRPDSIDGNGRVLSVDEVQRALDPDTTMLAYATTSRTVLWVIGRDEFNSYQLPAAAAIERRVRRLLAAISLPSPAPSGSDRPPIAPRDARDAAAALARFVLPEDAIGRVRKRIVLVPSGPLQLVPFGILPASPRGSGPMLLDGHEITTLPSASVIGSLRRADWWDRPQKTLAVFADPVLRTDDARLGLRSDARSPSTPAPLPRLLGTRWEARAISRFLPADRELLALDFRAARSTLQRVDLSKYRILHFGTHAIVDMQRPQRSGLVLSTIDERGREVDGFIRAAEILEWPLDADLVVLSGCRTGVGRDVRGEGLMALSRGFLAAGASRLVMSLWSVDDTATAELMASLYEAMLGPDHLSPAAALRAAQLHMRAVPRWQSPYFWSGFILQGEWR